MEYFFLFFFSILNEIQIGGQKTLRFVSDTFTFLLTPQILPFAKQISNQKAILRDSNYNEFTKLTLLSVIRVTHAKTTSTTLFSFSYVAKYIKNTSLNINLPLFNSFPPSLPLIMMAFK